MRTNFGVMLSAALALGLGSASCGSAQQCPTCPESAADVSTTEGTMPGSLDRQLIELAMRVERLDRMRIRVDEDGNVIKLAVYHHDADEIPDAVLQAATERFPDGEVLYYESEIYSDIGRVYEVEVRTSEGQECELSARPDGALVYVECEIGTDDVPAPVMEAVNRLLPNGSILEAETKEGPNLNAVHIEVRDEDDREHYLRFTNTGELVGHSIRVPATIEIPVP